MRMRRLLKIGCVAFAVIVLMAGMVYAFLPWADLRTEMVRDGISKNEATRGIELLRASSDRHGRAAITDHDTMSVVARDIWSSGGWWPAPSQRFRADRVIGTFSSKVELMDGPDRGTVWGIQRWRPWVKVSGSEAFEMRKHDRAIEFYLPTLHYFDELPFRLTNASIVADAGNGTLDGKEYERVFVTWQRPEAHADVDHYLLWIDPESRLIRKVTYTVRDTVAWQSSLMRPLFRLMAVGTIHFEDYRQVDGIMFPFTQYVTLGEPKESADLESSYLHKLEIESVDLDALPVEEILAIPSLGAGGDEKPS